MAARALHLLKAGAGLGPLAETRPTGDRVGFYVHVPFCAERCPYCAFTTAPLAGSDTRGFVAALDREVALLARAPWATGLTVETIFLGGGTPSVLDPPELGGILDGIRGRFPMAADPEITVECNPESVDLRKLSGYRSAGVNRLSLGVQSLDDAALAILGRQHGSAGACAAFSAAREAGFDNVSVDLMYGVPGLSAEAWAGTVDAVLAWTPEHLSAYGLSLDPGSRWGATPPPVLPAEDVTVAQYRYLVEAAPARGFEHYEISSWARPGRKGAHNLNYWRRGEYLAAGPGAAGFLGDLRHRNTGAVRRWAERLEHGELPVETSERLDAHQALAERLVLGLRTADGVPARLVEARAGDDPAVARTLRAWRERGLLLDTGDHARLTEAGWLVSDALFAALV